MPATSMRGFGGGGGGSGSGSGSGVTGVGVVSLACSSRVGSSGSSVTVSGWPSQRLMPWRAALACWAVGRLFRNRW